VSVCACAHARAHVCMCVCARARCYFPHKYKTNETNFYALFWYISCIQYYLNCRTFVLVSITKCFCFTSFEDYV
jgi:hypothetical protein